jgi:hypothetical protein
MFNFLKAGAKPEVRREKREKKRKKKFIGAQWLRRCIHAPDHL